jgi:hypothetical protein
MEYGMERIDDQAIPTILMDTYSIQGSVMKLTEISPRPPISKQAVWAFFPVYPPRTVESKKKC